MALFITNAAAILACNAVVDSIDGGSPGLLRIYAGSVPADADTALSGQTLLAQLTLSNPAFGNAADVSPGARATANAITGDASADATGTASFCRVTKSDGTAVIQGTVSASGGGGDLQLSSTSISAGNAVDVTSLTVTMLES